ncbi:MAG: hypothetical protein HKN34_08235 [Gammaproteobacteria bacterium]|nr:hypothetical protein [Gammaproteobacteria bacterium]
MAQTADEVYAQEERFDVPNNLDFLRQCIDKIDKVNFIDEQSEKVYLTFQNRQIVFRDEGLLQQKMQQPQLETIFTHVTRT